MSNWSGTRVSFPPKTRSRIMAAAKGRCAACGLKVSPLEADHIIPVAEGGTDDYSNGQALCVPCHSKKTRQEIARGRKRKSRYRDPEPHPGLLRR